MFSASREDLPRFSELEAEYEFIGELGRGGTAVVYLARERELNRKVAIKVIRATYVEDEEAAARLTREARTVAGMQHPNIVMLYGTRRLRDRSLALIMQYVEGRTLKTEVQENGPLSFRQAEQVLRDIAGALVYAHRHRIVHRDIKPENIYIDAETGIARLSDFGIARPWDTESGLTLPGSAIGTPAYMSPEQIDGAVLDGRSDLYSLGLVGYEMLTGSRPWTGESLFNIVVKQKHEELPSLAVVRPGIPPQLQHAIERAIRKQVDLRWQNAGAFLRALNGEGNAPPEQSDAAAPPAAIVVRSVKVPARRADETVAPVSDALTVRFERDVESTASVGDSPGQDVPTDGSDAPSDSDGSVLPAVPAAPTPGPVASRRIRRRPVAAAVLIAVVVVGTGVSLALSDVPGASTPMAGVPSASDARAEPEHAEPAAERSASPSGSPALALGLYGDVQEGLAGDTLPVPLVLRAEDAAGRAVAGASVQFAVVTGAGVVDPASAVTSDAGTATARWLPHTPGTHVVEARVAGVNEAVRFHARALRRPPARLSATSATELRGTTGTASKLAVKVEDDRGNAVAGLEVRFAVRAGGGALQPAAPVTDSDGVARADWILGPNGAQEAVASVPALAGANVVFRATSSPAPLPVQRTVALGGTHSCVLAGDGTASCWGGNDSGQLGDGTASRRGSPTRVAAPEPLATIAAGVGHSCAVGVSGSLFCWGANTAGQLGDGSRTAREQPGRISFPERLTSVAVGMSHSCALDATGRLFCWGQNTHGQLGDGTRTDRTTPVRAGGTRTFRAVALGWAHTCGLASDGAAYCWGSNGAGELGDGGTADRAEAARVSGGHRFQDIAAGSRHTCGLVPDGTAVCWGQNSNGQLGDGASGSSPLPVAVTGADAFSAITAGGVHTCALTRDGAAHCWGRNTYGQLGDGTTVDRARPTPVEGGLRFSSIFASGAHTCATAPGGALYCWGFNLEGQLGDGTRSNRLRPVAVARQG